MWESLVSFSNPGPSLCGIILVLVGAALLLFGTGNDAVTQGIICIAAGIGLMQCRQNNKTSEEVGAKKSESRQERLRRIQ